MKYFFVNVFNNVYATNFCAFHQNESIILITED